MRPPKRNRRLQFEVMESREVLSPGLAVALSPVWFSPPPAPHPPHHEVQLAVGLTTDHSIYQLGQPVNITLTEKNISSHDVQVEFGPSIDGCSITYNGSPVWSSNKGVALPQFIALETLKPGQSFTLNATWNGIPNEGPPTEPTGVFVVHNALFPNGPTAEFTVVDK